MEKNFSLKILLVNLLFLLLLLSGFWSHETSSAKQRSEIFAQCFLLVDSQCGGLTSKVASAHIVKSPISFF